jgi:sec-independent protein translocase protein TatA
MGTFSIWHLLILAVIALVLFGGRGKVSDLMGDFGRGVNSFKKGLADQGQDDPKIINAAPSVETVGEGKSSA